MFMWESNTLIKFLNKDGIELLVDITNDFEEVAYNVIPLFDPKKYQTLNKHYYYDIETIRNLDTLSLYKRKYQDYKSAYYL